MRRHVVSALITACLYGSAALRAEEEKVQRGRPVAAILDDGATTVAPLVEAKLLGEGVAEFVERNQIEQVLKEQRLQLAFSGDAVRERSRLGRLLKCDLLILLRTTTGIPGEAIAADGAKPPEVIECVVCETESGLRLHTAFVSKHRPLEVNVADLFDLVRQGLTRWRNRITRVFAVPPLISDDLDFRRNYLQSAYARLIQQQLLEIPGTVVVELAEAQAIAREFNLAGEDGMLHRTPVPFYIHGRYRNDDSSEQPTVKFNLRLEQGGRELRAGDSPALRPADAPDWLQRATASLAKTAGVTESVKRDQTREAAQLAKRSAEFMQIGHWDEALALIEASLLLNPNQLELRQAAVTCCGHVRNQAFAARVPLYELTPSIKKAATAYRRGLEHLEIYLRADAEVHERNDHGNFISDFDGPFRNRLEINPHAPEEAQQIVRDLRTLQAETFFRLGVFRAGQKHAEFFWFQWLNFMKTPGQRIDLVRRLIDRAEERSPLVEFITGEMAQLVVDAVGNDRNVADKIARSPEVSKLLDELDRSNTPLARIIVTGTRTRVAERFDPARQYTMRREPALRADPNAEFQLKPITFHLYDNQPVVDPPLNGFKVGENRDVFWGRYTVYVMNRKNILKPIWREPNKVPCLVEAAFDGQYVWCLLNERKTAPRLIFVDPEAETAVEFQSQTPFPPVDIPSTAGGPKVVGLSPGRALVVAYMGRTWIGVAESDARGQGNLRIIYEARGAVSPEAGAKQKPDVAFVPDGLFPLRRSSGKLDVVIARSSPTMQYGWYETALTYSDDEQTVKPTNEKFKFDRTRGIATLHGQLQYLDYDYPGERMVMYLNAMDAEEAAPRVLVSDVPWGRMVWHEGRLHIVGERWWIWNPQARDFRELRGRISWHTPGPYRFKYLQSQVIRKPNEYDLILQHAFTTRHYGLVLAMNHQLLLRAELPPDVLHDYRE